MFCSYCGNKLLNKDCNYCFKNINALIEFEEEQS
jgi:hypothetical protein